MGCAASSIDEEERVKACKERKKLMKQLIGSRKEFADALLAYLRALKNTGATLRQFTESETLELEGTIYGLASPPSPPPPLPPSPPPPPPLSPDLRKHGAEDAQEGSIVIDEEEDDHSSSPPILSSSWEYWDPFELSAVHEQKKSEIVGPVEEENWAETRSEFEEEDKKEETVEDVVNPVAYCLEQRELVSCISSTSSLHMKVATDMGMISWKRKKTLGAVVKELDEYFLKASGGIKEIAVLIDISAGNDFPPLHFRESKSKYTLYLSTSLPPLCSLSHFLLSYLKFLEIVEKLSIFSQKIFKWFGFISSLWLWHQEPRHKIVSLRFYQIFYTFQEPKHLLDTCLS